jgi:hypothetical protein
VRIIVFGSRSWKDRYEVYLALDLKTRDAVRKGEKITIVHGACPTGADYFADLYAVNNGHEVEPFPADWYPNGRDAGIDYSAGPRRNREMAEAGADIALGFRMPGKSNGTDGMRKLCEAAGIKLELYGEGWK